MKNTGLIHRRKSTDWPVGAINYEVRNPLGNWLPYLPTFEKQYFKNFDTMGCVSFSLNTLNEIQIIQQTGQEINFSDRFLAKMSGTTSQGNWLYIVADTLRNFGCVHEEEWPVPPEPAAWSDYYMEIPQFIKDRAKKQFLDKYDFKYESGLVTKEYIEKHLKHSPLWMVIPGHAVAMIMLKVENDLITYFDTYEPGIKTIPLNGISDVYKAILTVKGNNMVGYKKVGDPTTYVGMGNKLVPIADWVAFVAMGGSTSSIVELDESQWAKFQIINSVLFKLK